MLTDKQRIQRLEDIVMLLVERQDQGSAGPPWWERLRSLVDAIRKDHAEQYADTH